MGAGGFRFLQGVSSNSSLTDWDKDRKMGGKKALRQKLSLMDMQEEAQDRQQLSRPVHFLAPYAEDSKKAKASSLKSYSKNEQEISLMEIDTSEGRVEIKSDISGRTTRLSASARRPGEGEELTADKRFFNRQSAIKQRRTSDINIFLSAGKAENAAAVEFEQGRQWTDERMKLSKGEGNSRMLERLCPYADDTDERRKLSYENEKLKVLKSQIAEIQPDPKAVESLKEEEAALRNRIEDLKQLKEKKEQAKRLMLQKYKYAVQPTTNRHFFERFKDTSLPSRLPGWEESEEDTRQEPSNFDSEETDTQYEDGIAE